MKKIIPGLIAGTISIILVASVLVPVISSETLKDDLYVFGIFGQSNGAYWYPDLDDVNAEIEPVDSGRAFYFGTESRPIRYEEDPSACDIIDMCPDGKWTIGNIEPAIAKSIVDSGKNVLIINFGVAGFTISKLMPGGEAWDWETSVIDAALSKIDTKKYNVIMSGIFCVHGEADSGTTSSVYKDRYLTTMDALFEYGFNCSLISYVRPYAGDKSLIAQQELIAEYPDILLGCADTLNFTIENGLLRDDGVHYTQLGDNIVGYDMASAWLSSNFVKPALGSDFDVSLLLWAIVPLTIIAIIIPIVGISLKSRK